MRNSLLIRLLRPLNADHLSGLLPAMSSRSLVLVVALSLFSIVSRAGTLAGSFTADDNVQLFNVSLAAAATIDIRSYGYAGGTTSTGTLVSAGGFDTVLTLFSASGIFIADNDDGSGVAADPSTGFHSDARLTASLSAGNYIVALTQYDNFSIGDLADGFVETGNPNFTAGPGFGGGGPCPGNLFEDVSGTAGRCRTGDWTVDFVNVASVVPAAAVPEPSSLLLAGLGLALLLVGRARNRKPVKALVALIAAGFTGGVVQAQTGGPDYSKVTDFLNGKRTLVEITDLMVVALGSGSHPLTTYGIQTANSGQTNPAQPGTQGWSDHGRFKVLSGRIWNQPGAVTVVIGGQEMAFLNRQSFNLDYTGLGQPVRTAAIGDFNLDGLDELVLNNADGSFAIVTPHDVNNTSDPELNFYFSAPLDQLVDMAVGDFNGDGQREIAGLVSLPTGGMKLVVYTVDPKSFTIKQASSLTLPSPFNSNLPIHSASIARGRFNTTTHDQLVIAFAALAGPSNVEIIDFDTNMLQPRVASAPINPTPIVVDGYLEVKTGQFGFPDNPWDQIAYHSSVPGSGGRFVSILSVNPIDLTITKNPPMSYDSSGCGYGISVGNFDHQQADPLNPGQVQHNPNAQIALLSGACDNGGKSLDIYSVDPHTFELKNESSNQLNGLPGDPSATPPRLAFVATDLRGRSLTLGEPSRVHIYSTITPSVVIGAPPMHVDFISPDPGNLPPTVMNLSAIPNGYNSTYQQDSTSGTTTNTSNKTSWSIGAKESISGWETIGDPEKGVGEKIKDTFSAAQNLKKASEEMHGHYQDKSFSLSATTGFGDEVTFTDTAFNVWTYPVLGQTTCPAGKQCPPDPQAPLTIQFSAPDGDALVHATQGQGLQWYQPPWEPGNIFSYPANLQQLRTVYPNLSQLTNSVEFITDTSTVTQKTTWAVTQKDGGTSSVDVNFSFENDFSATGQAGVPLVAVGGSSVTFDVTGSFGLSNLTENTTNLGLSTGIQVTKPGTFPEFQNYGYSVAPYIMGTTQPGGMVDNHPLVADVQTFGLLRAMFTADPLAGASGGYGSWWKQAYNQPDVALNHPSRWDIVPGTPANPLPANCRVAALPKIDCAVLSTRSPGNPWSSTFHKMRGFFISRADDPGTGPQIQQATAGDVLKLQARVYNYSFAAMPAGSKVHARFYFMPWNDTVPSGDSVMIGDEYVTDPIPPFSDAPNAPLNWVLARATFDTKAYPQTSSGNTDVVFWVVVWVELPDGKLMPEMKGHGLTAIPGTLKSLADVAEECQPDGNCYSNNLGFYPQIFHIQPLVPPVTAGPLGVPSQVDIGKLSLSATMVGVNDSVTLAADVTATGTDATHTSVYFYEGDPTQGGRLLEAQTLPYVSLSNSHRVQAQYRAKTCGVHQLFVAVNQGKPSEVVRRAQPLRVACSVAQLLQR